METSKKILATVLIILIISLCIGLYAYRDTIFMTKVSLTYPDGCIEKYENNELITPECTEGRLLKEQQEKMNNPIGVGTPVNDLLNDGDIGFE